MRLSIPASTHSLAVARLLRDSAIAGVRIIPLPSDGLQSRSRPECSENICFNIDIDLSQTTIPAVAGYIIGRCRDARGTVDLTINDQHISSDDPNGIEAELHRSVYDGK
jgi:hypothetical protein